MYYKCCSPSDLTADKTSARVTGCSFSTKEFAKFLMPWCGWGLLNRNDPRGRTFLLIGRSTECFTRAEHREESSASSARSPGGGTSRCSVTTAVLSRSARDATVKKSKSSPQAVPWRGCRELWTLPCSEGPPTSLTFLAVPRAVGWHEMYVHSVTIYVNQTGIFHPFTSPDPAVNFPAATGTSGKPVPLADLQMFSLSLCPVSCIQK